MRVMGLEGVQPKRATTTRGAGHRLFPYLLRNVAISHPDQVWSADITYLPLRGGFVYLTAVIDWFSRYVLSWRLSNRLDGSFCLEALDAALRHARPQIFNTDQGTQFTSAAFTNRLLDRSVAVSMDGRGRALDNVFIERLWKSVKYEDIYLKDYATVDEVYDGLAAYFAKYNHERPHQALEYLTPAKVYEWERRSGGRRRGAPPASAPPAFADGGFGLSLHHPARAGQRSREPHDNRSDSRPGFGVHLTGSTCAVEILFLRSPFIGS